MNDDRARDPLERLPLTPAVLHILVVLAAGERHGYGIMQEVAQLTDGRLRLGPGTLYRSLRDLLTDDLIEETAERPAPDLDDERRRYYRLTEFGQRVAQAEVERLAQLVHVARTRNLLLRPRTAPHPGGN